MAGVVSPLHYDVDASDTRIGSDLGVLTNSAPAAPTINLPLAGTVYDGVLTLSATSIDAEGNSYRASFEYDRSDNNWIVIGDGATVASGAASTRSWDVSALARGTNYRVRARGFDPAPGSASYGDYTTTAAFTIGNVPVVALNSPVGGAAYSSTLTLDATLTDADAGATITATFEYSSNSGGAWTVIGNGTTVSTGGRSTRTWDISALTPGINYRVRVKATDDLGLVSGYTSTTDFLIGPSLSALSAHSNTALMRGDSNTASYRAEKG